MEKFIYSFAEGNKDMKSLLGGKGANLAEMTRLNLPVPPGFTITTQACSAFYKNAQTLSRELIEQIHQGIKKIERQTGKTFSGGDFPLLFSVRSGSVFSMPGMMDTILNLGLNDQTVQSLAKASGSARFAYDSYRRFIQMFSDVAMDIPKVHFEQHLEAAKEQSKVQEDSQLSEHDLIGLCETYKQVYRQEKGEEFPQDAIEQLLKAVEAVFRSWNNPRAIMYREIHHIAHDLGTAVNVQSMVFGNMGQDCATGVCFSRNPATGEKMLFGEYLINAQGEDVVAGIRTPKEISSLAVAMPEVDRQLRETVEILEKHYRDMQDIEFTIEKGKLYMLQTRNGKRTAAAAVSIAVDMVEEGAISREEALLSVSASSLDQLLHPTFDPKQTAGAFVLAKGLAASPGAASGQIYFHAKEAVEAAKLGQQVILVRQETSPEDLEGMVSAQGILTARGGMTSHAAVVARGMGKCCVAGCSDIRVDEQKGTLRTSTETLKKGDWISLDGSLGVVYQGQIPKVQAGFSPQFAQFMNWADQMRDLQVRANADTPKDARQALEFLAQGIGLCRTEHMFFDEKRLPSVRRMILSRSLSQRQSALLEILPMQRQDFYEMYKVMQDRPVTVRLLDPPLHEFLPSAPRDLQSLAESMGIAVEEIQDTIRSLHEFNPMLGHRGCRLAVTYPEIYRMQARAIIEAALLCQEEGIARISPEIMIPLVGAAKELAYVKEQVEQEIQMVFSEKEQSVPYTIGTMIEIPRACVCADQIAHQAEFFSFGTNDLTQMAFGFSRDDAGSFLTEYQQKEILPQSPFETIDQTGVGKLMEMAVELGRKARPGIKLGICGEHGGEPESIAFCHRIGLDYVSCSPFRVPIARLAAAQAAIRCPREKPALSH